MMYVRTVQQLQLFLLFAPCPEGALLAYVAYFPTFLSIIPKDLNRLL